MKTTNYWNGKKKCIYLWLRSSYLFNPSKKNAFGCAVNHPSAVKPKPKTYQHPYVYKATTRTINRSRDSVVGIATGYGLDDRGVGSSSPGRVKNFHFSMSSRPALGSTQLPIQWAPGTLSSGVKRQGRETDHSPRTSAQVNKIWIYTSTPPYAFMMYCLNT
jgi:hypothetical protein